MKNLKQLIVLFAAVTILAACKKENKDNILKNNITGTAKATNGQGVKDVDIKIVSNLDPTKIFTTKTDAKGSYSIDVPSSDNENETWFAYAYITKTKNNITYTSELEPQNTEDITKKGGERNFVWKLSGPKKGKSTGVYGGIVTVTPAEGQTLDFSKVELTFTLADAYLLDTYSQVNSALKLTPNSEGKVEVPIGRWGVSAKYDNHGASTRLTGQGEYSTSSGSTAFTFPADFNVAIQVRNF